MALMSPIDFDAEYLRHKVCETYDRVARELTLDARANPDLWAACIAGALVEDELPAIAKSVGLRRGRLIGCYDCFRNTSAADKVAKDLKVHGVTFFAVK
ncbi:hypothetical protein [Thiocapsa sp. UBA6158]|jgi:hypothetical protein|uniref:hypothetical protein n=1 Tax=Thiocapsa sp. UBA6158 TaxID=1947692 RepID=UPI0025EF8570|nr:hypothetical protein [Thiocapsa sp. UBA6158]